VAPELIDAVKASGLSAGNQNSLIVKLQTAQSFIDHGNKNTAHSLLLAFISEKNSLQQDHQLSAAAAAAPHRRRAGEN
jgi:hypothetical protein